MPQSKRNREDKVLNKLGVKWLKYDTKNIEEIAIESDGDKTQLIKLTKTSCCILNLRGVEIAGLGFKVSIPVSSSITNKPHIKKIITLFENMEQGRRVEIDDLTVNFISPLSESRIPYEASERRQSPPGKSGDKPSITIPVSENLLTLKTAFKVSNKLMPPVILREKETTWIFATDTIKVFVTELSGCTCNDPEGSMFLLGDIGTLIDESVTEVETDSLTTRLVSEVGSLRVENTRLPVTLKRYVEAIQDRCLNTQKPYKIEVYLDELRAIMGKLGDEKIRLTIDPDYLRLTAEDTFACAMLQSHEGDMRELCIHVSGAELKKLLDIIQSSSDSKSREKLIDIRFPEDRWDPVEFSLENSRFYLTVLYGEN